MSAGITHDISIRRELRDGDADGIAELHRRVYASEYGLNDQFVDGVRRGLKAAVASGWPQDSGAVWLVDGAGSLRGALGLTDEGERVGRVRWLVLDPALRGRGLGRSLVTELIAEARQARLQKLTLETYSDLTAAARIYRDAGFRLQWERVHEDWGPQVTFQGYTLDL
ncbi:MAG: GNAT family N-acetyltransferase [Solirubrobacteraceae bacterium]